MTASSPGAVAKAKKKEGARGLMGRERIAKPRQPDYLPLGLLGCPSSELKVNQGVKKHFHPAKFTLQLKAAKVKIQSKKDKKKLQDSRLLKLQTKSWVS